MNYSSYDKEYYDSNDRVRSRSRSRSRDRSSSSSSHHHRHHRHHHKHKHHDKKRHDNYNNDDNNDYNQYHNNSFKNNQSQNDDFNNIKGSSNQHLKFNPGNPSNTVMLRQLPSYIDENELRTELNLRCVPYKDCRLVRNRDTGASRGFAFVEFNTVDESQRWLESCEGYLVLNDDSKVQLFYSQPKWDDDDPRSRNRKATQQQTDWDCSKCGIKNFKRRDHCFKCNISKEESDKMKEGEGYEHIGLTPCNTLIIRGLDALTNEDVIKNKIYEQTQIIVKNAHIARDRLTNISNGYAFIEMAKIDDATYLIDNLPYFELEGKYVTLNYSKNNYLTALKLLESMPSTSAVYSTYDTNNDYKHYYSSSSTSKSSQADQANSAAAVAQAALKNMQKKQEILSHITNTLTSSSSSSSSNIIPSSATNASTSTANLNANNNNNNSNTETYKYYSTPDVSTYIYDEVSGYYYDQSTGFYYDANSQYYYNSLTQQYMYWDPIKSTYITVSTTGNNVVDQQQTANTKINETNETNKQINESCEESSTKSEIASSNTNVGSNSDNKQDNKKQKSTTKNASQIAKDMEKWAESMNKKKEATKKQITPVTTSTTTPSTPSLSGTTTATIAATSTITTNLVSTTQATLSTPHNSTTDYKSLNPSIIQNTSDNSSLNKKYQIATTNLEQSNYCEEHRQVEQTKIQPEQQQQQPQQVEEFDEKKFIDTKKLACLLCRRGFDSMDLLNKHIQLSNLHKTNLEKYKEENKITPNESQTKDDDKNKSSKDSLLAALQYRDRAKERREKYGTSDPPLREREIKERYETEQSVKKPTLSHSNVQSTNDSGSDSGSIGSKLMRKMGWNEGSGLGKKNQGISAPIEASIRVKGLGLGASGLTLDPNDSYKDCVKKSARARFEQLNS